MKTRLWDVLVTIFELKYDNTVWEEVVRKSVQRYAQVNTFHDCNIFLKAFLRWFEAQVILMCPTYKKFTL